MKRIGFITLGLAVGLVALTSCQNDDNLGSDIDQLELEMEAALDDSYESVDQVVESGFEYIDNVRVDEGGLGTCAEVTHDSENKTITIDFGDGCIGVRGNEYKGVIQIEYNERLYVPGAYRIITFVDFYINDIKVEGTRTLTNTTSTNTEREFTVSLENGKLDFGNGIFATRDAEWVRIWYVGEGKVTISGGAEGININGIDYTSSISSEDPITFMRQCLVAVPVAGTKTMVVGNYEATIDYGDGECDRLAEVTVNGVTRIRDLRPRRARR